MYPYGISVVKLLHNLHILYVYNVLMAPEHVATKEEPCDPIYVS